MTLKEFQKLRDEYDASGDRLDSLHLSKDGYDELINDEGWITVDLDPSVEQPTDKRCTARINGVELYSDATIDKDSWFALIEEGKNP